MATEARPQLSVTLQELRTRFKKKKQEQEQPDLPQNQVGNSLDFAPPEPKRCKIARYAKFSHSQVSVRKIYVICFAIFLPKQILRCQPIHHITNPYHH